MKVLFAFLFVFVAFHLKAQTLHLSIVDDVGSVLDCTIMKNDSLIGNDQHYYVLSVQKGDKFTLKHSWYRDTSFQITEVLTPSDTLVKIIQLKQKVKQIDEVVVSSEKYQLLYEENNEFVIDYYPTPKNNILILSKIGKSRFLKLLDENSSPQQEILLSINPTELFLDAMGNFHVVTKDSAYQLHLSDTLTLLKGISSEVFQKNISNLLAVDKNAFYQNYSEHNQLFTIESISKQNGKKEIYRTFDKVGYGGARYSSNKMIRYYLDSVPEWRNVILLGTWSGDLFELIDPLDKKLLEMYGWYKITALPLKVSAFGMLDNLVILDNVKNNILQLDYETFEIVHTSVPQFELSRHYYFDYFYDALYTYAIKKGITEVFKIDIGTGETISIAQLTDVLLPRNIKVSNKWVYFTVLDSDGYNKLLKARR